MLARGNAPIVKKALATIFGGCYTLVIPQNRIVSLPNPGDHAIPPIPRTDQKCRAH